MDSTKSYALNETNLVDYIKSVPALVERLGNCTAQEYRSVPVDYALAIITMLWSMKITIGIQVYRVQVH